MKGKGGIIAGIIGGVLLLAMIFYAITSADKPEHMWFERYDPKSKEPYDVSVIHHLLKKKNAKSEFKDITGHMGKEILELKTGDSGNYVLIGGGLYLDSLSLENLLRFVEKGNNAFVISRYFPENLIYRIYDYDCNPVWEPYSVIIDSAMGFNFYHPSLYDASKNYDVKFHRWKKTDLYEWNCIDYTYFCGEKDSSSQFISLGYMTRNDSAYVNFFKVNYGEGVFYFHCNPILFTNYYMVKEPGFDYAEKVFSHMSDGNIYWDERSKTGYYPENADFNKHGRHDIMDSPLRYLLSQTSLRWALYTVLALVLLYTFLRARRRQRPIPLLEPNTNTSLEFVTSIGRLYYLQRNHIALCMLKERQFLAFLRNRYGIHTTLTEEKDRARVAEKAGVSKTLLENITKQFKLINTTSIELNDVELIAFHQTLDEFYQTCK